MFRISEDEVLLGIVIAFAVLLFGLPLLQLGFTMPISSGLSVLLGFLGGSVTSLLLGRLLSWRERPIASVRLVEGKGCYVTTLRGDPPTHDARFLRVLIENAGGSSIKNCKGYVTSIKVTANSNRLPVEQEVLELTWSSGKANDPLTIPRGAFFYLNIASLDLIKSGPPILWLPVAWMPNHLVNLFKAAATFELNIKVASENAATVDRIVRFEFDPQKKDLTFQFD